MNRTTQPKMSDGTPRCCRNVTAKWSFHGYQCPNRAKYEHEGKPYCGSHHPGKRRERQKKRDDAAHAQWERRRRNSDERAAARERLKKEHAMMLRALKKLAHMTSGEAAKVAQRAVNKVKT